MKFHFYDSTDSNEMNGCLNKIDFGQQRCLGLGIRGVFNKNLIK